jgi:hypothetical protein
MRSFNNRLRLERRGGTVEIDASIIECGKLCAKLRGVKSVHGIPQFNTPIVAQKGRWHKGNPKHRNPLDILVKSDQCLMLDNVGRRFLPVMKFVLSSINRFKEKNMKKTAAIISACMLTFALSACSGSNYVMHTNDGRTIVSDGKPKTDDETGMISYKDANGNKQQINRTDVKEMVELEN